MLQEKEQLRLKEEERLRQEAYAAKKKAEEIALQEKKEAVKKSAKNQNTSERIISVDELS